jgi:hypothetical protein
MKNILLRSKIHIVMLSQIEVILGWAWRAQVELYGILGYPLPCEFSLLFQGHTSMKTLTNM